jgi:transposase-like protein
MRRYSASVKQMALEKVLRPGANLAVVNRQMENPVNIRYGWIRLSDNGAMSGKKGSRRKLQDKLALIMEARRLADEDHFHRWLREMGHHESEIEAWEREIKSASVRRLKFLR